MIPREITKGSSEMPANTLATGMNWSTAPEFAVNLMPTQLGNIPLQVTVNDQPAYLYFLCSGAPGSICTTDQIDVLTPLDSTVGPVKIIVYNGISSASFTANMLPAAPSFPLVGGRYVVATHIDNSLVGPTSFSAPGYPFRPAKPGETIQAFAFGLGLPKNGILDGSASQAGELPSPPLCQIGSRPATVSYAGLINPGLYQLNVVVPDTSASGDNLMTCTLNGVTSPPRDLIAVQP